MWLPITVFSSFVGVLSQLNFGRKKIIIILIEKE